MGYYNRRAYNPRKLMEPDAFMESNDQDWRDYQNHGGNEAAVQRSIAISLKRLADVAEAWAAGAFNYPHPVTPNESHPADEQ